jgi:hypothetical protein
MARPVYIVCAVSGSEDKDTGLISLFELIEKFQIFPIDLAKPSSSPIVIKAQPIRVVAHWMMEPEKGERFGDLFEFEFRLVLPPIPTVLPLGSGTFQFAEPRKFHRFTIRIETPLPFQGPGFMWVESLVRRKDATDWVIQSYPIELEEIPGPSLPAPSSPPTGPASN